MANSSNNNNGGDLRSYLELLEKEGELVRIKKPVSTKFELAAVVSKFDSKQAVLFEKVKEGGKISTVASNVCGTPGRFYMATSSAKSAPKGIAETKKAIRSRVSEALAGMSAPLKTQEGKALFEQNSSRNLNDLPIVTHFEKDAGAFATASVVFAKDGERRNQNSSTHRLLRLDEKHMAIRMVEGRHLHKCYTYAKEHGEDLKVAIAVGVHPAVSIAAAYQAAYGVDEMMIANALLEGKLKLAKTGYSQLYVPNHSEIIIEGRILKDRVQEEWMVEMLRTYDFKRKQPVFELEKLSFRDGAIYHDILPGYAEHRLLMGLPVEAKMYDYVKSVVPTTQAVHLTDGGSNWLSAVIQIKKRLEGEPKNAIMAAFAAHPSLKMATVVDDDIDPTDAVAVEYAVATRCQADRGFVVIPNAKGSSLDPSSDQQNLLTTKVGIDATATILKPKERFEIARIPGEDEINVSDYASNKIK
ncbi:UbiD family decarboxylase [Candidatus Nitrososphaera evergladensis SR1]|uniref:Anhydromevalonate phosphate decarboxylase n=1 Tax=Candidatus Nitrososphaera evergladensis SR1 TaxID=1459636 RepID=A0A075MUF7_9ARCH|nr:UbiD family decarboxylase [Candidatus Nitrososphaera evergladensis]AIF84748.1 UbiD family decarboxylase [Candidatus Nitrososphaera evergladensis SR1]